MSDQLPEVVFNLEMGIPIFPRPVIKSAVLVPIPLAQDGSELPTFIKPEWGGLQVFYGDYYAIVKDGVVIYGSAKDQWRAMHTEVRPGYWVKTAIPIAYQAAERAKIVTLIPAEDGTSVRETSYEVEPGDWIVRQPCGEVQRIKAAKYAGIYWSQDDAEHLGLMAMSPGEFAHWTMQQTVYETSSSV